MRVRRFCGLILCQYIEQVLTENASAYQTAGFPGRAPTDTSFPSDREPFPARAQTVVSLRFPQERFLVRVRTGELLPFHPVPSVAKVLMDELCLSRLALSAEKVPMAAWSQSRPDTFLARGRTVELLRSHPERLPSKGLPAALELANERIAYLCAAANESDPDSWFMRRSPLTAIQYAKTTTQRSIHRSLPQESRNTEISNEVANGPCYKKGREDRQSSQAQVTPRRVHALRRLTSRR